MKMAHRTGRLWLWAGTVFLFVTVSVTFLKAEITVEGVKHAKVRSEKIMLGEVSQISGEDPLLIDTLKSIVIGKSPLPGGVKEIRAHTILSRVEHSDVDLSQVNLNLPEKIEVERESVEITPHKVEKMVTRFILRKMTWDPDQVSIKVSPPQAFTLPAGKVTYEVIPRKKEDYLGATNLSVVFMVDGQVRKKIWVNVEIDVTQEVVVSVRPLQRHSVITPEDVRLKKMNLSQLPANVISEPFDVVGKRAKRVIDADVPLRFSFFEVPPLVKRGDLVTILIETEALKISTQGVVTENGCKGDLVRVLNTASRREVFAKVRDARTVEVDF
jgi:flagella basal body P-ring formation protein FlgA